MASIRDAVEESFQDNRAFTKYFLFAIPLYITYYLYDTGVSSYVVLNIFATFSLLLLLGILTIVTMNVRNNRNQLLPGLNLVNIFKEAFHSLLAIGPLAVVIVILANIITASFTLPSKGFDITLKIFIWCALLSIVLTTYLLFIRSKSIKEAYNLKAISDSGADIMLAVIFMLPQVLFVNAIFLGTITYVMHLFFGVPNPVWEFICCMFVVQNTAMIGNYLAQIAMENIEIREEMENYDNGHYRWK